MSRTPLTLFPVLLLAAPAFAQGVPDDAAARLDACRTQIAAGEVDALKETVVDIRSWGEITDPTLKMGADFCLEIAASQIGDEPVAAAEAAPQPEPVDPRLQAYLDDAKADGADLGALAEKIAADSRFKPAPSEVRDALEAALIAHAKPIPAAQAKANRTAYAALARIDPENATYAEKVKHYTGAMHATGKRVYGSLRKITEAYDNSSWSRHPSSPRYQDIRDYVTLYLLDDGKGKKTMEFFLNYTSRDGWLFVESARLNLDGEEVRVPISRWFRDNDSEIWEYGGVEGAEALKLAARVANAKRAVVRFYGRDFYDDHVVSATEKTVLREMLAVWDFLEATK